MSTHRIAASLALLSSIPFGAAHAQRMQTDPEASQGVVATYEMSASLAVRSGWSGLTPVFEARLISFDGVQLFDGTKVSASDMPQQVRAQTVRLDQARPFDLRVVYGIYVNGDLVREYTSNAAGTGSKPTWVAVVGNTDGWPGLTPVERAANKGRKMFSEGAFSIRIHRISYTGRWSDTAVRAWLKSRATAADASGAASDRQVAGNPLRRDPAQRVVPPRSAPSSGRGTSAGARASRSSGQLPARTSAAEAARQRKLAEDQRVVDEALATMQRRAERWQAEFLQPASGSFFGKRTDGFDEALKYGAAAVSALAEGWSRRRAEREQRDQQEHAEWIAQYRLRSAFDTASSAGDSLRMLSAAQQLCNRLVLEFCSHVGWQYLTGTGVPENHPRAVAALRLACHGKRDIRYESRDWLEGWGCALLGSMHAEGKHVPRNDTTAFELFDRACDKRSTYGCLRAGESYYFGVGTKVNLGRALDKFARSCTDDTPHGCLNAGIMYAGGKGTRQNHGKALQAFRTACAGGLTDACANAGMILSAGLAGQPDYAAAVALLRPACDANVLNACASLASIYLLPDQRSLEQAAQYARKVCDADEALPDAGVYCYNVGTMAFNGEGLPRDTAMASRYWSRGCERGSGDACYYAGSLAWDAERQLADTAMATRLFGRACDLGNAQGCAYRGNFLVLGFGGQKDVEHGLRLMDRACEAGETFGCALLAALHIERTHLPQNAALSARYAEPSCRGNDQLTAQSCYILGSLIALGAGVPKDPELSKQYLTRGCDLGSAAACRALARQTENATP